MWDCDPSLDFLRWAGVEEWESNLTAYEDVLIGCNQQCGTPRGEGEKGEAGQVILSQQVFPKGNGQGGSRGRVVIIMPRKTMMILEPSLEDLICIQHRHHSTHFVKYSQKLPEKLSNKYPLVAKGMTNYSNFPFS